jgi:hypothetical protein
MRGAASDKQVRSYDLTCITWGEKHRSFGDPRPGARGYRAEHYWRLSSSIAGPFLRKSAAHSIQAYRYNPGSLRSHEIQFSASWISVSEAHSCESNEWAIHNSLKECDLELPLVLNFEEFLFAEENALD